MVREYDRGADFFAGIGVLDWARREYANARATLPLVDADSRLGWEPSMEYVGGRAQIEWKLALMEETYGRKTLESASLRR